MAQRNLADPSYEPTDEELADLMRGAFADVRARHETAQRALRERIAMERVTALRLRKERQAP